MSNIDNIRDKNDHELLEELTNINRDMLDLKFKLETKQLANAFEIKTGPLSNFSSIFIMLIPIFLSPFIIAL